MDQLPRTRLAEWGMDAAAAACLAGALAFAWAKLAGVGLAAALAGLTGFALAFAGLRRVRPEPPTFVLPELEPQALQVDFELEDPLDLSAEMAVRQEGVDELVLDDVLASMGPDSRVVRLFEPVNLPTAGELQATIDRHLKTGHRPTSASDASDALHEALAELRRSLR